MGDLRTQTIKKCGMANRWLDCANRWCSRNGKRSAHATLVIGSGANKVVGVPKINLRTFVSDNLIGYNFLNRFFRTRYEED